ncbi:MAG: Hsp33 family molecular chaperone HslO [Sandaracinaceae bacterium]
MASKFPGEATADHALTAITHDGAFRVIVARTAETVSASLKAQADPGPDASAYADVLTATILVRLTMAPTYRVQGIVRGAGGRGTLVGDSHPNGTARGLIQRPTGLERISVGEGALMQMMRTLPRGDTHQGIVQVPHGGVSEALMSYLQSSEQLTSVAQVGTLMEDEYAVAAGGYVVQLLPEVSRDPLEVMTARLSTPPFSDRMGTVRMLQESPAMLLGEILYGMPYELTQQEQLRFGCHCSRVRVLASLSTLPRSDIEDLMKDGEELHITCDYCGQAYALSPEALVGLLSTS